MYNDDLTRAPEHDFIPRADADKLIEQMKSISSEYRFSGGHREYRTYWKSFNEAITEYEQKHGEKK